MLTVKWIKPENGVDILLPIRFQNRYKRFPKKFQFHFGSWKQNLSVQIDKTLPNNMIALSSKWKEELFIPEDLSFEYKIKKNSLHVGPMILWIAANTNERLNKRLNNLQKRIEQYVPVRGMICLCAEEGVNPTSKIIEGYYFHPNPKKGELKWKKATFSYPGAIFKRVRLSTLINDHLNEITNGRMFNSYFYNKWEMWQWLSPDEKVRKHLPYTKKVNNLNAIKKMIKKYPSVYVKPIRGSEGKRISNIKRLGSEIYIKDDNNKTTRVTKLEEHTLLNQRLNSSRNYLVQQDVSTKHEERNVDFRIYMQKSGAKRWKSSGITARVSKPRSIITNLRRLDYWQPGYEAFRKIYNLDENNARILEKKIVDICTRACKMVDNKGTYGDIAIDFVIDKNLHVWILEMNLRHVYPVEDPTLAPTVKRTPFLYAMSLAGFPTKKKKKRRKKRRRK